MARANRSDDIRRLRNGHPQWINRRLFLEWRSIADSAIAARWTLVGHVGSTKPAGEFHDIVLPGLSLQPLVENAIRHGIAKRVEGGAVEISVHRNGKSCSVDVFSPPSATPVFFREGHALANVRDRLQLHAGGAANVDIAQDGASRLRVSLVVPI